MLAVAGAAVAALGGKRRRTEPLAQKGQDRTDAQDGRESPAKGRHGGNIDLSR
jgi:hypothetical protein